MFEIFPMLKNCPLFFGLSEAESEKCLERLGTSEAFFHKGDCILREGNAADRFGILLSGKAEVSRSDYSGNRSILAVLGEGDLFAEAYALGGAKVLTVSVNAFSDCKAFFIRTGKILADDAADRRLVNNLLMVTARKNLLLNEKIEIISKRTIRDKLLTYLTLEARKVGSYEFTIPFDRQGLADYIEADRSAVAAEIGKLRKEGILESERSRFRLITPEFSV